MTDRTERAQGRIGRPWGESTGRRVRRAGRTRPYVRRLLSAPSPKPTDASPLGAAAFAGIAETQAAARSGDTLDDVRAALAGPLRRLIAQRPGLAHPACAAGAERDLAEVAS